MGCLICPVVGWTSGWASGLLGSHPPSVPGGRAFSAALTANFLSISIIALKAIFNFSLCKGEILNARNLAELGIKTIILGIIYSIGVNYLLNNYVFSAQKEASEEKPGCCQHKKSFNK